MFDIILEIFSAIKRNKLRTALTGFAVAWGIFILIVLMGAGNGLINAFELSSSRRALNSFRVYGGSTTKAYEGLNEGRSIDLENSDVKLTAQNFKGLTDNFAPTVAQWGLTASRNAKHLSLTLNGSYPAMRKIEGVQMLAGRFINEIDIRDKRKVLIIDKDAAEVLYADLGDPMDAVGHTLNVEDVIYTVVGIYKPLFEGGKHEFMTSFTTLQTIYGRGKEVDTYAFMTNGLASVEDNDAFEAELRRVLAENHRFDPEDQGAVNFWNRMSQYVQTSTGMSMLTTAVWVIGIFTLLSGIVGVSNIMLITVKERTREFGIRKALGAKPLSILALVLAESVAITTFFGYIGMVAGIGVTELASSILGDGVINNGNWSETVFTNPTVELHVAIEATLTLVIAGTIAGFIPAQKAVKVKPIEALRAD